MASLLKLRHLLQRVHSIRFRIRPITIDILVRKVHRCGDIDFQHFVDSCYCSVRTGGWYVQMSGHHPGGGDGEIPSVLSVFHPLDIHFDIHTGWHHR